MNEFEIAVVSEPSVLEPLKFYCSYKCFHSDPLKTCFECLLNNDNV